MKTNPPKFAKAILQRFCNLKFLEEIEGDLNEEFQRRLEKQGVFKANLHYFLDVFHSIQLYPTKRTGHSSKPSLSMVSHNLLIIYRNFLRFKSTFLINFLGLSTGLTCLILIYLWVNDELNFDTFHEKKDRVFQVMEHRGTKGAIETNGQTSDFLADALAQEMPEIERAAVVTRPVASRPDGGAAEDDHPFVAGRRVAELYEDLEVRVAVVLGEEHGASRSHSGTGHDIAGG